MKKNGFVIYEISQKFAIFWDNSENKFEQQVVSMDFSEE